MKKFHLVQVIFGAMITVGFIAACLLYFIKPDSIPEELKQYMGMIVGTLQAAFITVVQYAFGSSKGSSDKTDILTKKGEGY